MKRSNGFQFRRSFPLIISHPISMCHGSSSPSTATWETRTVRSKEPNRAVANQQPTLEFPDAFTVPHLNRGPELSLDFSGRAPWNIASQKSRSGAKAAGAARKWGLRRRWGVQMRVRQAPDAAGGEIARASRPLNLMQFFSRAPAESLAFFPMSLPQFQLGTF